MPDPSGRVHDHLATLYPSADDLGELTESLLATIEPRPSRESWSERDAVCITYADTLVEDGRAPLQVLDEFVRAHLTGAFSIVHVLPFFPSSSDRGFAIIDYLEVDPALGSWEDIATLASQVDLMIDLVANHVSAESAWFRHFVEDREPGRGYFVVADPAADYSSIVRPRTQPLLREVETAAGTRHVWCTFSPDQVDLDYTNPEVLLEIARVIDRYLAAGARFLRLDAIAYVWKELGTPGVHLPQTHELIRLLRTLLDERAPGTALVAETNVPHEQNVSYFGDGDEAQLIYNFSLPPLVLHALHTGESARLHSWLAALDPAPPGCAYLNFLASHDGLGVRPAEGLLRDDEIEELVALSRHSGGTHSRYGAGEAARPYELNTTLWDALGGPEAPDRFLAAHALMLSLAGIPAIYIHSLLATPNDRDAVGETGDNRAVNRSRLDWPRLRTELEEPEGTRSAVLRALCHLLRVRARQPAFHPDAPQRVLDLGDHLIGVERTGPNGAHQIRAIVNLSGATQPLDDSAGVDLISGTEIAAEAELAPYQAVWLV